MNVPRLSSLLCTALLATASFATTAKDKLEGDLVIGEPSDQVAVIVFLRRQHAAESAALVNHLYAGRVGDLRRRLVTTVRASARRSSSGPEAEKRLIAQGATIMSPEVAALSRQMDALRQQMADEVVQNARSTSVWDFSLMESRIRAMGGTVRRKSIAVSAIAATVERHKLELLATDPEVRLVILDSATSKELNVSGPSLGAPAFWNVGANGGPYDVGVLDSGVYEAHPALASLRFESNNGSIDNDGHGTHVAGILASGNNPRRGMAFGVDTMSVATALGADESSDMVNMDFLMTQVQERAELVNYSYGSGLANDTDYSGFDQFFDGVIDTFDIGVSKSTGNNDHLLPVRITHPAPAYNLLACASINDFNTVTRADDRISVFSSSGPTLGGRKKPDISAPGEDIESLANFGAGFTSLSGTSMSAPHVGGGLLLLLSAGSPSPLAAKATLLNTADAMDGGGTQTTNDDVFVAGSHWDPWYGWGYLNLGSAALHVGDVFDAFLPAPATGGSSFKLYFGTMFQNEKATATWNRHVAYSGPQFPSIVRDLSNLDLGAYSLTGDLLASSTSLIDNVEQLSVPVTGLTVLKVSSAGPFDPAVLQERFALATQENFVEATGPKPTMSWFKVPAGTYLSPFPVSVTVTNTGDLPMLSPTVTIANYAVVNGQNPRQLATLLPGDSVQVTWTVRRQINTGNVRATATLTSQSFGESWNWVSTDPNPL